MPSFRVNSKWGIMTEIVPGLYLCGVTALKPQTLSALDINLVVNCTSEVPNLSVLAHCERVKLWLEDTDDTDLRPHFDAVCDHIRFVLTSGGRVLVHCVAGVSRSAAFCLAYLMKYESIDLRRAYRLMTARRPMVRPNLGFWKCLIDYETTLRPDRAPTVKIVPIAEKSENGEMEKLSLPDVYLQPGQKVILENNENEKENQRGSIPINIDLLSKRRHSSGGTRVKFVPRLASVPEN